MERNANLKQIMEWLVYLYLFIVMQSQSTGTTSVKMVRITFIGFFALYFVVKHVHWKSWYLLWSIVFLLYNYIMCNYAFSTNYAKTFTSTLLYIVAVDLCVYFFLCEYDILDGILKVMIAGAIIMSLRIYVENGIGAFFNSRQSDNISANLVGYYCAISLIFSFYLFLKSGYKKKRYLLMAVMLLVFTVLTASRKSFIVIGLPLVFYYVVNAKNMTVLIRNIILALIFAVVVYFLIIKMPFLYKIIGRRIESMIAGFNGEETDASTRMRLNLITWGMEWFKERPIFGYGLSNFRALMRRYHPEITAYYAHNNYVELLVNCGIVGTTIYYSLYAIMIVKSYFSIRRNKDALTVLMTGILIAGLVCEYGMVTYSLPIYQFQLMLLYWLLYDRDTKGVIK